MLKGDVFEYQEFQNQIFALFINLFMNNANGVARGYKNAMNITYLGHTVTIASGACLIQGRLLEEDSSTTLDTGIDTSFCKLVVEIDLNKVNTIEEFNQGVYKIVKGTSAYPTLTQENIVQNNSGKYQYELARFKISDGNIVEFEDKRTYIEDQLQYNGIATLTSSKAPNNHASSNTTYGLGTQSNYGHNKLINNLTTTSYQDGMALSAYQGKLLNDKVSTAQSTANTARTEAQNAQSTANSANSNANSRLPTSGGTIDWLKVNGYFEVGRGITVEENIICNAETRTNILTAYDQITNYGALYNNGAIRSRSTYDDDTVTNSPNMYVTSNGWFRRSTNTSSQRYKKDIKELKDEELNSEKLYDLKVKQFKYKKEYQPNEKDTRYDKNLVGFIAEDVAEVYPIAADFNEEGQVENWNERYLIPPILDLIQKQNERIKALEEKVGVEK